MLQININRLVKKGTFLLPAILLIFLFVAFRLGSEYSSWANFQPLTGFLFCSIVFLKGRAYWIPITAWVVSYGIMLLRADYSLSWHVLAMFLGGLSIVAWAFFWKKRGTSKREFQGAWSLMQSLFGVMVGSILFYTVSNTISWLTLPDYARTWEGFLQAQWFGPPHLGPTWVFLRSALLGDLLFSGVFLLAMHPVAHYLQKTPSFLTKEKKA